MSVLSAGSAPDLALARAAGAPQDVAAAIGNASRRTGVDFAYLVAQAKQESSFRADVKASTSSATGLYQFIEQTWLGTVKEHGAKHGLGDYAAMIRTDARGRHHIADPAARSAVLALRKDPQIAALMAAEHARENGLVLQQALGRQVTATDLYMAHFLGVEGAREFLLALDADGGQQAAALFPKAAQANRGVFYTASGQPRSLAEVYEFFARKFDDADGPMLTAADRAGAHIAAETTGWRPRSGRAAGFGEAAVLAASGGPYPLDLDRPSSGNTILTRPRLDPGTAPLVPSMRAEAFLAVAALQEVAAGLGAAPERAAPQPRT